MQQLQRHPFAPQFHIERRRCGGRASRAMASSATVQTLFELLFQERLQQLPGIELNLPGPFHRVAHLRGGLFTASSYVARPVSSFTRECANIVVHVACLAGLVLDVLE
jgi:hypothetical protein